MILTVWYILLDDILWSKEFWIFPIVSETQKSPCKTFLPHRSGWERFEYNWAVHSTWLLIILQLSPIAPPPLLLSRYARSLTWYARSLSRQLTRPHRNSARYAVWLWDRSCALTCTSTLTPVQDMSCMSAGYVNAIVLTGVRWEPISEFILERNRSLVLTAPTELLNVLPWNSTLKDTRKVRQQVLKMSSLLCSVSCCGVVVSMPVLQGGDLRFESRW